jgi:hypothetical protein
MAGKLKIYMRVTGHYQGVFKGEETVSREDGEGDDWFEISSVSSPPPGGKYKNKDGEWVYKDGRIAITKIFGTLAFAKAQAITEPIDKIEIQIVGPDQAGVEQILREYTLTDALIASRTNGWDSANLGSMESMSITFQKMEQPASNSDGSLSQPMRIGYDLGAATGGM